MSILGRLRCFFRRDLGYHRHSWRKNDVSKHEHYPVCVHCGEHHLYVEGTRLLSGTIINPDPAALKVWDRTWYDSEAGEYVREQNAFWGNSNIANRKKIGVMP